VFLFLLLITQIVKKRCWQGTNWCRHKLNTI